MTDPDWRLWVTSGEMTPGGPYTWHIFDWDQRRLILVTSMSENFDGDDGSEVARETLEKHIRKLAPDVNTITVSGNGDLISVSTNPRDDGTLEVYYPPVTELDPMRFQTRILLRTDLIEIERLGPDADLGFYHTTCGLFRKRVVFKYYTLRQFQNRRWKELNIWIRLPRSHPNIVHLDCVVLDEVERRIVGFTTLFVPGGTLNENKQRIFKLAWLNQLTRVVDDLNLKYGIMHQDIAPRNLVVDPKTDQLQILDFDFSCMIRTDHLSPGRDDVSGVLFTMYEIVTRDEHFREVPHEFQHSSEIERIEWVKHPDVKLDHSVSEYQKFVLDWAAVRRRGDKIKDAARSPTRIDFPEMSRSPIKRSIEYYRDGREEVVERYRLRYVRDAKKLGEYTIEWQRPARVNIEKDTRILGNGQVVRRARESGLAPKVGKIIGCLAIITLAVQSSPLLNAKWR